MKEFTVEALDEYIRLQTITNDHQIRAVLTFDIHLDLENFRESVRKSLTIVPILNCKYEMIGKKACWVEHDFETEQFVSVYEINEPQLDLLSYLTIIPNEDGPQILFQIIRQTRQDTLIICLNHMAFDGSGFKSYLYLLADLYSKNAIHPLPAQENLNSDRSLQKLFRNIPLWQRAAALFQKSFSGDDDGLLTTDVEGIQPRISLFNIPAEQFLTIKSICKQRKITLNDFVLASFAYALIQLDQIKNGAVINMQTMFDLRRYVKMHPVSPFGNFSSMESLVIVKHKQSFTQLADEISKQMESLKSNYPGLKNAILMDALYKFLPQNRFDKILSNKIKSIGISSSNLGIIDNQKCHFNGVKLRSAYLLTSMKTQPAMQLSFSSFENQVTLSILGNYSSQNWQTIERIKTNMEVEIQKQCTQFTLQ